MEREQNQAPVPCGYLQARGVAPRKPGAPLAEEVIRRIRDKEGPIDEVRALFQKGDVLYYSDVVEQTGLDLEMVVEVCRVLQGAGEVEVMDGGGPMIEGAVVVIKWHDARFFPGTYDHETIISRHKMSLFESLGYLIARDNVRTVIAAERNDEDEYRDITFIPTGSILSMTKLEVVGGGPMMEAGEGI